MWFSVVRVTWLLCVCVGQEFGVLPGLCTRDELGQVRVLMAPLATFSLLCSRVCLQGNITSLGLPLSMSHLYHAPPPAPFLTYTSSSCHSVPPPLPQYGGGVCVSIVILTRVAH